MGCACGCNSCTPALRVQKSVSRFKPNKAKKNPEPDTTGASIGSMSGKAVVLVVLAGFGLALALEQRTP